MLVLKIKYNLFFITRNQSVGCISVGCSNYLTNFNILLSYVLLSSKTSILKTLVIPISKTNVMKFTKLNKHELSMCTRTGNSLIFKNIGVFMTNNFFFIKSTQQFKFRFKKLFFSFLYPNQLKKSLMNMKKKIIISRFFFKKKYKSPKMLRFSLKFFKKKFTNHYNFNFFNQQTNLQSNNLINLYKNSKDNMLYQSDF